MFSDMEFQGASGLGTGRTDQFNNEKYREKKLALIQKIPTPIKPIQIDKATRHITLAYFDQRSTVDYIGTVQGIPVCFDAKECRSKTFPIQNIHEHQVLFMQDFEDQGGVAFLLIYFSGENRYFYLPFDGWPISGTVPGQGMPKAFIWKNWMKTLRLNVRAII